MAEGLGPRRWASANLQVLRHERHQGHVGRSASLPPPRACLGLPHPREQVWVAPSKPCSPAKFKGPSLPDSGLPSHLLTLLRGPCQTRAPAADRVPLQPPWMDTPPLKLLSLPEYGSRGKVSLEGPGVGPHDLVAPTNVAAHPQRLPFLPLGQGPAWGPVRAGGPALPQSHMKIPCPRNPSATGKLGQLAPCKGPHAKPEFPKSSTQPSSPPVAWPVVGEREPSHH